MNSKQCVEFVRGKLDKWTKLDKAKMGMLDAVMLLDNIIDESDPDVSWSVCLPVESCTILILNNNYDY